MSKPLAFEDPSHDGNSPKHHDPTERAMTESDEVLILVERVRTSAAKASPGPWWFDTRGDIIWRGEEPRAEHMIADESEGSTRLRGFGAKAPIDQNAEFLILMREHADRLARIVEMYHHGPFCNHAVKCGPEKPDYAWCLPCRARAIAREGT